MGDVLVKHSFYVFILLFRMPSIFTLDSSINTDVGVRNLQKNTIPSTGDEFM